MSIQPNRVLARIIEQVDQSDWPRLSSRIFFSPERDEWVRLFDEPLHIRYATPFHFWVHALRDDLSARGRESDLVPVAGHALCQSQPPEEWRSELEFVWPSRDVARIPCTVYRMQSNECRRSSVAIEGDRLLAHFWGHGFGESWRRKGWR